MQARLRPPRSAATSVLARSATVVMGPVGGHAGGASARDGAPCPAAALAGSSSSRYPVLHAVVPTRTPLRYARII